MFRINNYNEHPVTGFTEFDIDFDLGAGTKNVHQCYTSAQDARKKIHEMRRDYILIMIERYVNHSRILFETSHRSYYSTKERIESLDRCRNMLPGLQQEQVSTICSFILNLEDDLNRILPCQSNPSYKYSYSKLYSIIAFCNGEKQRIERLKAKAKANQA